jgi:MFS family permease
MPPPPRRLQPRFSPVDGAYAWVRLAASMVVCTIGGVSTWSVVVTLPVLQSEFGVARASASLPYTLTMVGVAMGNVAFGRMIDRVGIVPPLLIAGVSLGIGYIAASHAASLTQFALISGVLIALLGGSVTFGPLMADLSQWFVRRRGLAVAIVASGSYLAGTIWPPLLQYCIGAWGWRATHMGIGVFCAVTILPLSLLFRRQALAMSVSGGVRADIAPARFAGLSPSVVQVLLSIAGVCCCVAMAMPQVHLVAYCGDLGYGPARGAQMLSLMLASGIVSRIASGHVSDRIGGLPTLLVGSVLQLLALLLYSAFDGLASLYAISIMFGLFQGGIVPSYAIIVREYFPAREAGSRIGVVLTCTMLGMALGGWMSGAIFDLTGSYRAAFLNGAAFNLVNLAIAALLLTRGQSRRTRLATA